MRQLSWVAVSVVCGLLPFGTVAAPGWMSARAAEDGLVWEPHPVTGPKSPAQVRALEEISQEASLRGAIENAIRVAKGDGPPELLIVPVPAPQEVRS